MEVDLFLWTDSGKVFDRSEHLTLSPVEPVHVQDKSPLETACTFSR